MIEPQGENLDDLSSKYIPGALSFLLGSDRDGDVFRPISTRRAPVIFSPPVGISIIGAFSPAFFADAVQKGRSLMAGRLGAIVASTAVSLVDNGLLEGALPPHPMTGRECPRRGRS